MSHIGRIISGQPRYSVIVACDENPKGGSSNGYTMTAWRLEWRTVLRLEAWMDELRRLTIGNLASQSARFGNGMDLNMGGSEGRL
jgi:hypothetical protein